MAQELAPRPCMAVNPCYGSDALDCGATTWYTDIRWTNSPRKLIVDWEHEYAVRDVDGTFTQTGEETFVIPNSGTFDPSKCSNVWPNEPNAFNLGNPQPVICFHDNGNFKPHRFAFNNPSPPARVTNHFC